jgi:hypothetical protein
MHLQRETLHNQFAPSRQSRVNRRRERLRSRARAPELQIRAAATCPWQPSTMKTFLTVTLVGLLLAGFALGTLVEGSDEPVRQGTLLGFGVWLTVVGIRLYRDAVSLRAHLQLGAAVCWTVHTPTGHSRSKDQPTSS